MFINKLFPQYKLAWQAISLLSAFRDSLSTQFFPLFPWSKQLLDKTAQDWV